MMKAILAAVLIGMLADSAVADTVSVDWTSTNGSGAQAPMATFTLGNNVVLGTVSSNSDAQFIGFAFNSPVTFPYSYPVGSSFDGWGTAQGNFNDGAYFNFPQPTTFSYEIGPVSLLGNVSSAAQLFAPNADGAEVFAYEETGAGQLYTWYGVIAPSPLPLPGTAPLLAAGACAFVAFSWLRKRSRG